MGRLLRLSVAAVTGLAAYLAIVRPRHLTWGATPEEVVRPMPGDAEVERPMLRATRAVTIRARPDEVWPWLVQMGYGRAGFYAYDWIDNARKPSARQIVPEWQSLRVGDTIPTGPRGEGFLVAALERPRLLCMAVRSPRFHVGLAGLLEPVDAGRTRLVMRLLVRVERSIPMLAYLAVFDPGDFVMMRKMLLGIRERAEAPHTARPG